MPGRANQRKADDETNTDKRFVEAEKDTQGRVDALKAEVSGHFHTSTEDSEEEVEGADDNHNDESHLFVGVCHGGPMNLQQGQSRFGKGFVLLDERDSRAWVYDRHGDGFIARKVQPLNREGAEKAAREENYDVRAYDRETMGSH